MQVDEFYTTFLSKKRRNVTTLDTLNSFRISLSLDNTDSKFRSIVRQLDVLNKGSGVQATADITPFVQNTILPNITLFGSSDIQTPFGSFSHSGYMAEPDQREFSMDVLNTKAPILEALFYPWMREASDSKWAYNQHPYTTGTFTIDLTEHTDIKYRFYGCFPTYVQTYQPSQSLNSQFSRQVRIRFQFMAILQNYLSLTSELKDDKIYKNNKQDFEDKTKI